MEALPVDIIMLLCSAFSLVYTSFYFFPSEKNHFYVFMYLSITAFFVGKLYNLIFELSGGDSYLFSLGDLGNVSGFLLSTYAVLNLREEKKIPGSRKGVIYSLIVPAIIVVMWVMMFLHYLNFEKMMLADMYLFSSTLCSFTCVKAIYDTNHTGNSYRCFSPLWGSIAALNILTMVGEMFWIIDNDEFTEIAGYVLLIFIVIFYMMVPISLERGLRKCRI